MGFVYSKEEFNKVIEALKENYKIYAPVLKVGEGRFRDTDVIRYDYIDRIEDAELETRSDFSFKEILIPLSETMFFFTEDEIREAGYDPTPVIVLMRSCDIHAVKRLDRCIPAMVLIMTGFMRDSGTGSNLLLSAAKRPVLTAFAWIWEAIKRMNMLSPSI